MIRYETSILRDNTSSPFLLLRDSWPLIQDYAYRSTSVVHSNDVTHVMLLGRKVTSSSRSGMQESTKSQDLIRICCISQRLLYKEYIADRIGRSGLRKKLCHKGISQNLRCRCEVAPADPWLMHHRTASRD